MSRVLSVNQVLSTALLDSRIFDDLIWRLADAAPEDITIRCSVRPLAGMDVYHYHRPNRESRLRRPAVATVHHDPDDPYPWLRLRRFVPRWREADTVICLNTAHRKRLAAEGIGHTVVIPHGVDRDVFPTPAAPRRAREGAPLRLGIVSKRYARGFKGEDRMHALFARLDPARFAFTIAGNGRLPEAQAARERGFAVAYHPVLPYRLFGALYERIDVLLVTSHWEAGPASLPEALGAGVPVAATAVGMVPDMVADGVNGIVLCGDAERDAAALTRLAKDPGLLRRLQDGAFATAPSVPDWGAVMDRQFALYRSVAALGKAAG